MTELTLFASTFVLVFALGMQSLNVNNGHYVLAALTSFVIGSGQMVLYKLAPHASWSEIAAYLLGGPVGITCSMRAHPVLVQWMRRNDKEFRLPRIDITLVDETGEQFDKLLKQLNDSPRKP